MYYPDLSPYVYFREHVTALPAEFDAIWNQPSVVNIGWLDPAFPFETGIVSERFMDRLFELCRHKVNQTRGLHFCPYCTSPATVVLRVKSEGEVKEILAPVPMRTKRNHISINLGSAEIRVVDPYGVTYACPDMIYHYVADHGYLPPDAFINAVLGAKMSG